jgi:hypothetical protein
MFIMRSSYEQRLRAVNEAMKVGHPQLICKVEVSNGGFPTTITVKRPFA